MRCRPGAPAQAAPPREVSALTERELGVFRLIALAKLNLRDRAAAVVLAYETGRFDTDPPGNGPHR